MIRSLLLPVFAVVALSSAPLFAQGSGPTLTPGAVLEGELSGAGPRFYALSLTRRQIARVIVDQKGVDAVLSVFSPDGSRLQDVDGPNGSIGDEEAIVAAGPAGTYRVEVRALDAAAASGRYTIRLDGFLTEAEYDAEKLAGLGRVWGAVRYFHPYLAYKDVDWDAALVKAVPRVKEAWTPKEYQEAINSMLGALDDPLTSTATAAPTEEAGNRASAPMPEPQYVRVVDGYMVIEATEVALASVTGKAAVAAEQTKRISDRNGIRGILIDCRYGARSEDEVNGFYLTRFLGRTLPSLIQGQMMLGTERYRLHEGYRPQEARESMYQSSFAARTPDSIMGEAKEKAPLAILVDDHTPDLLPWLSGLQAYGGRVVHVGVPRYRGGRTEPMSIPGGLRVNIRVTDSLNPDGSTTLKPDLVLDASALSSGIGPALAAFSLPPGPPARGTGERSTTRGERDAPYPGMSFPAEGYRLLALFRLWNVIHYFHAYRALTDVPWDATLKEFVPRFLGSTSALEYQTAVAEMVARMQDSHGYVVTLGELEARLGLFAPSIRLGSAGGRVVVTEVLAPPDPEGAGVRLGDEVLSIDGEPVQRRVAALAKVTALSTPQAAYDMVYPKVLRGPKDSAVAMSLRTAEGATREVTMKRTTPLAEVQSARRRTTPVYGLLPGGYGYIDLARLPFVDAQKAVDAVMKARAVIFDMRGYPNGTAWEIAPRLTEKNGVVAASFRTPRRAGSELTSFESDDTTDGIAFYQKLPPRKGEVYHGKVVVLINENAVSQSEHTCLFFEVATDVTFVGGPTNGTNGDVTTLMLPGGIRVGFTGTEVRHADGRRLQRVGIQPDLKVEPSARGIADGRDEVLEAAVRYLEARGR